MNIEVKSGVYNNNGEDAAFNFYTSLSAYNKVKFVDSVVSAIVTDDGYNYVIKDMIFDFMIVSLFTDIDVSQIAEASNNIDAIENFLDETNIVDIVKMNVSTDLIDELKKAVELNIEYKTGIHIDPISSSVASLIDTLEGKFNDFDLNLLMDIAKPMSEIAGEFTPEKIIDAYAKTDIFKEGHGNMTNEDDGFSVIKGGKKSVSLQFLSPLT